MCKHNHLCISTLLLLASHADASEQTTLPWASVQHNDDFFKLLLDKPPVGINIFSQWDAATGKVPDARGLLDGIEVGGRYIIRETGRNFNAVNPVTSLYGNAGTSWGLPASSNPFTDCWVAYGVESIPMIHLNANNWVHSLYHWEQELSKKEMMIVTRALRKEIGGIP